MAQINQKSGFTIVELMVVIVVIGILTVVSAVSFSGLVDNAKATSAQASARSYIRAIELDLMNSLAAGEINDSEDDFSDNSYTNINLNVSGTKPSSVALTITDGTVVSGTIMIAGYTITISDRDISSVVFGQPDSIDENYTIYEENSSTSDIIASFDSSVKIGTAIGTNKTTNSFNVLTYNTSIYDNSGLLTFDVSSIDLTKVSKIELFAYYYYSDIPARQQTHPVRKMISSWNDSTNLTYAMMDASYTNVMTSVSAANNGYGWRKADVTNIVNYWKNNPSLNYGIVIDNNRSTSVAGGYWSNMYYYTTEMSSDLAPRLKITYNSEHVNKYIKVASSFDSAVKIGTAIGTNKDTTSFNVVTYDVADYDTSGLLKFNIPESWKYDFEKANLFAYYYNSDIPDRQQTHPVRKMISSWDDATNLTYAMMDTNYMGLMTSINTANYGYGWRTAGVTDAVVHWKNNPSLNYGIVIDNNRSTSVGGGYWSNMSYYSNEANNNMAPYLQIYIKEK